MKLGKLCLTGTFLVLAFSSSCFADTSENGSASLIPSQIIYSPRLPTPSELAKVSAAQGSTIGQITQTADSITVQYILANGQKNTVAYRDLSSIDTSSNEQTVIATPTSPAPVVVTYPTPRTVIYTEPSYYYNYPYYDPWFVPVGLSIGFGWHSGHGHERFEHERFEHEDYRHGGSGYRH
jgi:hypothetical protein